MLLELNGSLVLGRGEGRVLLEGNRGHHGTSQLRRVHRGHGTHWGKGNR